MMKSKTHNINKVFSVTSAVAESKAVFDEIKDDPGNQAQNPFKTSVIMKQGGCDSCSGKKGGQVQLAYDNNNKLTIAYDKLTIADDKEKITENASVINKGCTCGDNCACVSKKESKMSKVIWFLLKMVIILILLMVIGAIILPWVVVLSVTPSIKNVVKQVKHSAKTAVQEVKKDAVAAIKDIKNSIHKASIESKKLVQQGESSIENIYAQVKNWAN